MNLSAKRTQWPVGQGCFASGTITSGERSFVYVYDCGSENQGALRQAIINLKPQGDLIDAFFISHLDSDHVNGVDYLCSACGYKIDAVYLPYLSLVDCLLVLGSALADDSFSWTLTELVVDPREWFGQRGVARVIVIPRRDIDDEEGPTVPEELLPDISPNDKLSIKKELDATRRFGIFELPKLRKIEPKRDRLATVSIASSKVFFFLSNLTDAPAWILVPFVPPVPEYAIDSFKNRVQKDLGLTIGNQATKSRRGVG